MININTYIPKSIINAKINIYEAFNNGYITNNEKESLINILTETTNNKKQKILNNQNEIKLAFPKISNSLKKMVLNNASKYDIKIKEEKFFKNHEDHKEQHYKLTYSMLPSKDLSKSDISRVLSDIGDSVEIEFNDENNKYLSKGLYFDNEKKGDISRFVELHYDFY